MAFTEDAITTETKLGSSAKSMGGWWLLKSTELVIERYLQAVQCFKAVCLFDSEFELMSNVVYSIRRHSYLIVQ